MTDGHGIKPSPAQRRQEIERCATKIYEPGEKLSKTGHPSHTTHLSVIDAEGNAVSMTLFARRSLRQRRCR